MPWTMTRPADKRTTLAIRSTGLPGGAIRHDQGVVHIGIPTLQNCPANLAARVYSIAPPAGRAQFLNIVLCPALTDEMFHSLKTRPGRIRFKGIWCGTQTSKRPGSDETISLNFEPFLQIPFQRSNLR
jgi:hypothetical protein